MDTSTERYRNVLETSLRIAWRVEDVLPNAARLDPTRSFLPDSLAQVERIEFLDADARRTLNQIRGHSYLCLFGLVEEFILPFVVDHARTRFGEDDSEVRALLQFASEEAKHIELFKRFAARFAADLGGCPVIGPASEIGKAVLAHHPLGVGLITLHIEWMTQRHYVEAVRDAQALDPLVRSLLRHHWLEEAQHARLDTLIVEQLAERSTRAEVKRGLSDYQRVVQLLDDGLCAQVELDIGALETRRGEGFRPAERTQLRELQRRAYRDTFIASGARHPRFLETFRALAHR
jgi:hypothetical protein